MELTQQNLLRVGDIIGELERNIGSLKRQAAKAERYISYRNELEDLQLYESAHKWLELRGWIMVEANEVERLVGVAEQAKTDLAARETDLAAARLEAHAAEEAQEHANTTAFSSDNEARAEEAAIIRAKDRIVALRRRESQAEGEMEEIAQQAASLTADRQTVDADIAILEQGETGVASAVFAEEEKLAELASNSDAADRVVVELRQVSSQAQQSIAGSDAKLEGVARRKEDLTFRHERLTTEREHRQGSVLGAARTPHAARPRDRGPEGRQGHERRRQRTRWKRV